MSSSSSSPSSPSSSPAPARQKRKRELENTVDSDSDVSDTDSDSDSSSSTSSNEEDKPITPAEEGDGIPVLSHAAKRKQKQKEQKLQKQKDDLDAPKKKRKLKDGTAINGAAIGKVFKRQNSVWVGNMSFKTTEENIRTFFKDRGAGEVTRINMPTKAAKGPGMRAENRGFAYVDFETPEAKNAAIALSEQPLLGRKLLIKDGDDYKGRPEQPVVDTTVTVNGAKKSLSKSAQKILRNQKQPPAPTLFFGNLSFDTTEDSIRELLEAHREKVKQKGKSRESNEGEGENGEPWIRKVRLGTFEDSGKCKGQVIFICTRPIPMILTTRIQNHHLNGRELVVEYASAEAVRRGAPKGSKPKPHGDTSAHVDRFSRKPRTKKDTPPHKAIVLDKEKDGSMIIDVPEEDVYQSDPKPIRREGNRSRNTGDRDNGRPRGRPKPGAALALAKRESAAIVPSQGQKISF
ncbi:hypothetical protein D9756_000290 [Leucocoprinus leucothites]|uniref:RRM domain-containing protein n=1 Tax=Leucocoprinus leucothites TaxID=201217 RepID=A0A8H5GF86_9AGAR|nr:hypothetical protein D9756_000290 [Leucoagaricus leucothites]